jgi:hypothetical protein
MRSMCTLKCHEQYQLQRQIYGPKLYPHAGIQIEKTLFKVQDEEFDFISVKDISFSEYLLQL